MHFPLYSKVNSNHAQESHIRSKSRYQTASSFVRFATPLHCLFGEQIALNDI